MSTDHPLYCAKCNNSKICPIVYAYTKSEFDICALGWARIGSKIDGPLHRLWYCDCCRSELNDNNLAASSYLCPVKIVSVLLHRKTVRDMLARVSNIDEEQRCRLRGQRWFDMVCQAFTHGPESIHIIRSGQIGLVRLQFADSTTSLPDLPGHMLSDLVFFIRKEVCKDDKTAGIIYSRDPLFQERQVTCQVSSDDTVIMFDCA